MNILLWLLQIGFGLFYIVVGVLHFSPPAGLPAMMSWMYDLPAWAHWIIGILEILGGLGLILPGILKTQTQLTPLAALGLAVIMVGAIFYHLTRGEFLNIGLNVVNILVLLFIFYGRWSIEPLEEGESPVSA